MFKAISYVTIFCINLIPILECYGGDSWSMKNAFPTKITHASSSIVLGKLYVIGGQDDTSTILNTTYEYDTVLDQWTIKNSMTQARTVATASQCNGKIYVFGGYTTPGSSYKTPTVEEYDPLTSSWLTKDSEMPTPRAWAASATVNDKIYVIGGTSDSGNFLDIVEEYDPMSDSWTTKNPMPNGRAGFTLSVVNGKIYAIGGSTSTLTEHVDIYDPQSNTWVSSSSTYPLRTQHASAVIDGKIYIFGGANSTGYSNSTEEYNYLTDSWVPRAAMHYARVGLTGKAVNGKIYAIGGGNSEGFHDYNEEYSPPSYPGFKKSQILNIVAPAIMNSQFIPSNFIFPVDNPNEWRICVDFQKGTSACGGDTNTRHLGEDWNWGPGTDSDAGKAVRAVGNGEVIRVEYVSDPDGATGSKIGWGKVVLIKPLQ